MGQLKDFLTEYDFYPLSDTFVCSKCFEDYGLKKFISENAKYDECSYCGKWSRQKHIAIHINELIIYLLECIGTEWGDPNDEGVGWDSREGGWISAKVIDTYDLLNDEINLEVNHEELREQIIQALFDKQWCQKDPHGLLLDDDLYFSWQRFSRQIMHEARYVFFRIKTYKEYSNESDIVKEPYEIMEHLGSIINELDLVATLPKNTKIYRARASSKGEKFTTVQELGPPDHSHAKYSNRMSPAGIPMFYGALEKKTALREISDPEKQDTALVSLAPFRTLDDINILDLTKVPGTPSIFDEEMRNFRWPLSFLNSFLSDFTEPTTKDGREHIEYVPPQVVTEYFRHVFLDEHKEPIHGILYPSSRHKDGRACVFFFDQSNCTEKQNNGRTWKKQWLLLDKENIIYKGFNQ